LDEDVEFNGSKKRLSELIAEGYYINSISEQSNIIPKLSSIILQFWVKTQMRVENPSYLAEMLDKIFGLNPNFNFSSYEEFHSYWEAIRRYCLFLKDKETSIRDLYLNPPLSKYIDENILLKNQYSVVKMKKKFY